MHRDLCLYSQGLDVAVEGFCEFIANVPPKLHPEFDCLADFIRLWFLHDPSAIRICGNDRQMFLAVVICIIDRHQDNPAILDYRGGFEPDEVPAERRVEKIFNKNGSGDIFWILDPYTFVAIEAAGPAGWSEYKELAEELKARRSA